MDVVTVLHSWGWGIKTGSCLVPFNEPTKSDVVTSSSVYVKGGIKTGSCLVPFNEPTKNDAVPSSSVSIMVKSKKYKICCVVFSC